jgi:ribosome-associated heat shock protein Hsp15
LRVGDGVEIRRPPFMHRIVVKGLSERRGPAAQAQALYEETSESRERRVRVAAELKAASTFSPRFPGRPTKKDRRAYERWFRGSAEESED